MARVMVRGNKLYLDYRAHGKRVQRSTGLENTPENVKRLKKEVIPALILKIKTGDLSKPSEKKFSHYYHKWLRTKEHNRGYKHRVHQYKKANERFGGHNVAKVTRMMVKEYIASLAMKNYSKAPYLNCISGVLDMALDDEAIKTNPCIGIKLGYTDRKEVSPFSEKEAAAMIEASDGMFKNYLAIALYTGMRPSEILGLMHSDITEHGIKVVRAVSNGKIDKPKNKGSVREVPLFDAVRPYLEDQMKRSKSFFIFEKNGDHLRGSAHFRYDYGLLLEKIGVEYRSLYNTRHTFITTMLNSGKYRILDIAAMVGHANASMIMTTYAGFIKGNHLKIDTTFDPFSGESGDKAEKHGGSRNESFRTNRTTQTDATR